ncbi:putative tryptophan repeat family protein [Faustovirus]|nr:putative tryptophan repeat family protein [Faustovirus]QJX73826.1 hypothetical protein F-E9_53 [Faustovirus]
MYSYPSDIYYNIFRHITTQHQFLNLRCVDKSALTASISFIKFNNNIVPPIRLTVTSPEVSNEFIRAHFDIINWRSLEVLRLHSDTIIEFANQLNLNTLMSRTIIPPSVILAHRHRINPNLLFAHQPLDIETVDILHADGWIPWQFIHSFHALSGPGNDATHAILDKYARFINWNAMPANNDIPERIIERFADNFNWRVLIKTQRLTPQLLIEHADKYDINAAIAYQEVPMEVIDARIGQIDWCIYSRNHHITPAIRKKYETLICYRCLAHNRI